MTVLFSFLPNTGLAPSGAEHAPKPRSNPPAPLSLVLASSDLDRRILSRADRQGGPPSPRKCSRGLASTGRVVAISIFAAMVGLALYGTIVPPSPRCSLPGAVGCPGGVLGPVTPESSVLSQWFDVTMYDWGFWIVDSSTGANESGTWTIFEGYTINVNATSLPADPAVGGTAYHGLGIEVNATGQQLLSLPAPVGQWVSASFVAPTSAYYHQHIWCTIQCGPGHGSQQENNLNIVPAVVLPKGNVSANVTVGPVPLSVTFSGIGSSGVAPYNLSWSFGDGSPTAYGSAVQHTYTLGGIYFATLTVTDVKGSQGQASTSITVLSSAGLNATLTASPTHGLIPFSTNLSVIAHGGTPPYQYLWNYGDGSVGLAGNLTRHLFTVPGVYATAVNVTDSNGAHSRVLTSVVVDSSANTLTVTASAAPANGTAPFQTALTAVVGSGGTPPYTYAWVFGDQGTATGASVTHIFNQTGFYNSAVFVSDSAGHSGNALVGIPINASQGGGGNGSDNRPTPLAGGLTVRVLVDPAGGSPPLQVEAIASVENGTGLGESATWTFGDGSTSTGLVVTHTYSSAGTFFLTALITDSGGNSGSGFASVRVAGPTMTIVVNQSHGDTPFAVDAGVTLTGGSGPWSPAIWEWGDGTSTSGFHLPHLYALNDSGPYTIRVSAMDAAGHAVNGSLVFQLTGVPLAVLTASIPAGHGLPVDVTFYLRVTGGTGLYAPVGLWSFGDLSSTRGPSLMNHTYARTGHFHVVAETNDSEGRFALAGTWVNLSSAVLLPPTSGGGSGWIFKGVSDPATASFLLMGIVGITGLGFLVRKHRRKAHQAKSAASTGARVARPSAPGPRSPPKG